MDCLSFSFNKELPLPIPCLAFSRLRDEGVAFPCEADICGMMTTLVMQEISQKPSYFCNVASVDNEKSRTVLRHCVAPLQLLGRDADPLPYRIRDYHGTGRGATPEVSFPSGMVAGSYTKALREEMLRLNVEVIGPMDSAAPA